MDDFDLIRSFRKDEARPSPVARAAARDQLEAQIAKDASSADCASAERPVEDRRTEDARSTGVSRIMVWLAGADGAVLAKCPYTEQTRFAALGGAVLTSALIAGAGVAYLTTMLQAPWAFALPIGAAFGIAVVNLDRWMLGSLRHQRTAGRTILTGIPRLLLALMIGLIVSEPLVLRVFEQEVNRQALVNNQTAMARNLAVVDHRYPEIRELERRLDVLRDQLAEDSAAYFKGDRTRRRLVQLDRKQVAAAEDNLFRLIEQRKAAETTTRAAAARPIGFLDRVRALNDLKRDDNAVSGLQTTVQLLIVLLLSLPIVVRLLTLLGRRSIYDRLADQLDEVNYIAWAETGTLRAEVTHAQRTLADELIAQWRREVISATQREFRRPDPHEEAELADSK